MRVIPVSPTHPDALPLLDALSDTLGAITGDSGRNSFDPADVTVPGAAFVVAYTPSGMPVGCGAYRPLSDGVAELKRMFARPDSKGVGSAILQHLEGLAAQHGYREVWLETRAVNVRAVSFYERNGYRPIPNFGKYVGRPEAVCFAKALGSVHASY
jgi:GNAT superfamily N-acetyltransferase